MKRFAPLLLLALASQALAGTVEPTLDLAAGAAQAWSTPPGAKNGESGEVERARARLGLTWSGEGGSNFEGAAEAAAFRSKAPEALLPGKIPLRLENSTNRGWSETGLALAANLDRLNVKTEAHGFRMTVGRQPIGHGSGKFFNPSDIFAPVNPSLAWTEYKPGIDAARVTRTFGELSEGELYLVAHREGAEKSYYLARGRVNLSGSDLSLYTGYTLGAPTLAFDLSAELGPAAVTLDGVARFDRDPAKTARVSVGGSGRVGDDLDLFAEYLFSGPGTADHRRYRATERTAEWENGELFLHAENYAAAGATFTANPLLTIGLTALLNLDDASALLTPRAEYWATERLTLTLGASLGFGGRRASEFGPAPDFAFLEARYYR